MQVEIILDILETLMGIVTQRYDRGVVGSNPNRGQCYVPEKKHFFSYCSVLSTMKESRPDS